MIYDKDKHIEQLELTIDALTRRLAKMNEIKNRKNGEQALKWRNSAFYWKQKGKFLESFIKNQGLELPSFKN